jgi:hypothetical protein
MKGLPVVIVSPGPSLDKNIDLLHLVKGRAVIVSAAQCAKALSKVGVVPDFVVVADPGDLSYFLDGVDTSQIECLIVGVCCHPKFYQLKFKNIISFNANADIDQWISNIFEDTLPISSAGSVSLDCFHIFKYLGAKTIITLGLDLSLKNNAQYSSFSANGETEAIIDPEKKSIRFANVPPAMEKTFNDKGFSSQEWQEPTLSLPGYYGGTVVTRSNYHLFHGEFVRLAGIEKKEIDGIKLINSTEGGCYIPGFDHISFREAIEKYIPTIKFDIEEIVTKRCLMVDVESRQTKLKKTIKNYVSDLKQAIDLANQCIKLTTQPDLGIVFSDLDFAEKALIETTRRLPFLSIPSREKIQASLDMVYDSTDIRTTNDAANIIYHSVVTNAKDILEILQNNY